MVGGADRILVAVGVKHDAVDLARAREITQIKYDRGDQDKLSLRQGCTCCLNSDCISSRVVGRTSVQEFNGRFEIFREGHDRNPHPLRFTGPGRTAGCQSMGKLIKQWSRS